MKRRIQLVAAIAAAALSCKFAKANVLLQLPNLPVSSGTSTNPLAYAYGLSADGNTIVGTAATVLGGKKPLDAVEWNFNSANNSMSITDIGSLNTQRIGSANAVAYASSVSGDGSMVAGSSTASSSSTEFGFLASNQTSPSTLYNLQNVKSTTGEVHISEDAKTLIADDSNSAAYPGFYNLLNGNGWISLPLSTASVAGLPSGYTVSLASAGGVSNVTASVNGPIITDLLGITNTATSAFSYQAFRFTPSGGYTLVGTSFSASGNVNFSPTTTTLTAPAISTPITADGRYMASVGTNPVTGKEDAFEYDALTNSTDWFNATELGGFAFTPTAITDDGSFVVGRDYQSNNNQDGWIWSASTGFETIGTFLTSEGLDFNTLGAGTAAGDVYGVALNGDTLAITGLLAGGTRTAGGSFYAQVAVPEPTTLMLVPAAGLLLLRRRRPAF